MKKYSVDDEVDVIVIGTGAGGAPVIARLATAGLSVVALEAGRWWKDPANDFATDEVDAAKLYWNAERLSGGETPSAFGANNSGTGVGGSTLHWGAFVPRGDPRDFRLHSEFAVGVDWPLGYHDLKPYYQQVEQFLGVSGPATYPWDPERTYPLGPVPLNAPAEAMQLACEQFGIRTSSAPVAALSRDYSQLEYGVRKACVNRGYCHQGCRNGAKASMDVTYLRAATAAGAEIRAESFVHQIETAANGRVEAVVYRHDGRDYRQRCKALYLCAGAIETPRLLLHTGLANASGQVGRNFMAHVATQVWGTFVEEMRPNKGFPASLISEDMIRPRDADFAGGYITQSLGIVPVTWAMQVARGRNLWGQALVDYLHRYNHVAGIGINGECFPHPENFLELSTEVDDTGVRKPLIHFSYGKNEKVMSAHAANWMTQAWQAVGASDIWTFERSAHTIGTCRMGANPNDSVVDLFGRSHDVSNLWIVDNSIFPSSLPANPALTIMALALRSSEAFLRAGSA